MRPRINKESKEVKEIKELDTVTYSFADGTKQVQPVNKESFFNEKNRRRSNDEMIKLFQQTMYDKGAISFSIDAEEAENTKVEKEIHFTIKDRKNAKRDYKEFRNRNLPGFINNRKAFRTEFLDKLKRKLKFNLTNVSFEA